MIGICLCTRMITCCVSTTSQEEEEKKESEYDEILIDPNHQFALNFFFVREK